MNCTVPVGVPAPGDTAVTVALNVTGWPNAEGLTDDQQKILAAIAPAFRDIIQADEQQAARRQSGSGSIKEDRVHGGGTVN